MYPVQFYHLKGKDFFNAGRTSTTIKRFLREKEYPPRVIQRVAIIAYEAEINIVCYTDYGYFFLYFLDDRVRIVVKDRGQGIEDIDQAMQEGFSTASDEIRKLGFGAGMGLANIKKNADRLHIQSVPGVGTVLEIDVLVNSEGRSDSMGTTLREIMNRANLENLTDGLDLDKAVTGGYAGDLLSDVNANSSAGNVWVTVLTHPNVTAVAGLKDLAGVIIAGGIRPGADFVEKAFAERIPILFTEMSAFDVVAMLSTVGVSGNS
ncbi:MAG: ATP-binding protein [Spirochaetota bacterium]|jgi:serine/threonine-protein kinase RsbT